MNADRQDLLRHLPAMDELLRHSKAQPLLERHARAKVKKALREALNAAREAILDSGELRDNGAILDEAANILDERERLRVVRAINATGIILHTGLGRAVLPETAIEAIAEQMRGYCVLEAARESGERFDRNRPVANRLCELTGAEAATVANNNAGATMLVLTALARGREVIVSRGQLVEIGGSFRLPDIMAEAGVRLVEVGTTNHTHRFDYEKALSSETAAIMRVHTANYRIVGSAGEVETRDLAELAHQHNLLMIDDIGSGAPFDLERWGLGHERTARDSIREGADVVMFSGDKLLGGPQCGVILGGQALIERVRKHPLARALRMDKLRLLALEETLRLLGDEERVDRRIPTYEMLARPLDELRARAEHLAQRLRGCQPALHIEEREDVAYVGGGSVPGQSFPTWVVAIRCPRLSAGTLARVLRQNEPPIYTRVQDRHVLFDMRTVLADEDWEIVEAVANLGSQGTPCGERDSSGA